MPILGDATVVIARVARSTSNALRVQLTTLNGGQRPMVPGIIGWSRPPARNSVS